MDKYENKELILKLVEKFKASVPIERKELVQEFEKYLYDAIQDLQESEFYATHKEKKLIEATLIDIAEELINSDIQSKERELLIDENYCEIKKISNKSFKIAQARLNNEKVNIDFDIEKEIGKMRQLLENVKGYNKQNAEALVSEGILDFRFLEKPETEIYSLRLAHIKNWQENINNKEHNEEEER